MSSDWIESLSPWPAGGFGLDRMRALLAELGDPQLRYPSVHVVGTNGKSTTTRAIEATLGREGLRAGAYTSPHVRGWAERIRVGGREADFEAAVAGVRPRAVALGATQFEALTAAAVFRRSGVLPAKLDEDGLRIFEAVVKPARTRPTSDAAAERTRLRSEVERGERKLANPQFVEKAPPPVVEAERAKLERYRRELDALGD